MAKKLETGGFKWPGVQDGVMRLTAAQLGALLEGRQLRSHPAHAWLTPMEYAAAAAVQAAQ